jgi:hypothetical protein
MHDRSVHAHRCHRPHHRPADRAVRVPNLRGPLSGRARPEHDGTKLRSRRQPGLVFRATFEDGTIPKPPENGCLPDVPGGNGCPLLSPKPPVIPAVPSSVSCTQVCAEYGKSIHQGVEVGFTCDATLCTAQPDDSDLVQEACTGLGDSSVAEIFKLETLVGRSCSASQICGCAPNKKTNQKMFDLNKRQRARNIAPQCDLNATLCGAKF